MAPFMAVSFLRNRGRRPPVSNRMFHDARRLSLWTPVALTLGLVACSSAAAPRPGAPPPVIDKPFAPGGRVVMHLSAGQYVIDRAPDDRIVLSWKTREPRDANRVRAGVEIHEREATIRAEGPSNGFDVTIAVPQRSNLWVRLSAGDLTIRGVEGHKDVSAWAGELKIGVGSAASYRAVDAAVLAGEIQAAPFNGSKGGLFRSFSWSGSGSYELRARLTAGEITLREQ